MPANWDSPEVLAQDLNYVKLILIFCLGLYVWEFLLTLSFERDLILRRFPFKWPYVTYFFGRYTLLGTLVLIIFTKETTKEIDCELAFKAVALLGNMITACASTNLMIRTTIIWRRTRAVLWPLAVVSICHWVYAIISGLTNFNSAWSKVNETCILTRGGHTRLAGFYLYTMLYDLLVFIMTIIGLTRERTQVRWSLYTHLYRQGVLYFCVSFLVYIVPLVLASLDLNAIMNVMFYIPAATASTIASSRVVLSLLECRDDYDGDHNNIPQPGSMDFLPIWKEPKGPSDSQSSTQLSTQISASFSFITIPG